MKKLLLMTGAAMLASTPALADAKPGGPKGKVQAAKVQKMKAPKIGKAQKIHVDRLDRNRNGIADWNERWTGRGNYGGNICPPGLMNRVPACVPPGQAGRVGGIIPTQWGYVDWDDIPLSVRNRYDLDDDWRYTYYGRRLYVVDPATSLITRIINGVMF